MSKERDLSRLLPVGEHIRRIRESKNLSQDEVAERCTVTKGNLSMIENGNKDFYFSTFLEIAKALEVEPKELLDF